MACAPECRRAVCGSIGAECSRAVLWFDVAKQDAARAAWVPCVSFVRPGAVFEVTLCSSAVSWCLRYASSLISSSD
eukprot:2644082-Prymnesium_polylepis.1